MKSNKTKTDRLIQVWAKTKGVCSHCGNRPLGRGRTIDHYIPRSLDGGFDLRNLMPLCRKCNEARGNQPINPFEFYTYAPKECIIQCIKYEKEFNRRRRNIDGDQF